MLAIGHRSVGDPEQVLLLAATDKGGKVFPHQPVAYNQDTTHQLWAALLLSGLITCIVTHLPRGVSGCLLAEKSFQTARLDNISVFEWMAG